MNNKKYKIGFMIQEFIVSSEKQDKNLPFPELQNYHLYLDMANKSNNAYEIKVITYAGEVLTSDLKSVEGNYKDYNFDFIIILVSNTSVDSFKIFAYWVPPEFLMGLSFSNLIRASISNSANGVLIKNSTVSQSCFFSSYYKQLLIPRELGVYNFNSHQEPLRPKDHLSEAKLVYIAFSDPLKRHGELIRLLDKKDYCEFYGPMTAWKGIKSYQGQLDMGNQIFETINNAGICLAIHSPLHRMYEFYTNRVFECISSGAIMITDKFNNLDNIFGDTIFSLDFSKPDEEVIKEIDEIVFWVRNNPEEAKKKVLKSQEIYKNVFLKKDWLLELCKNADIQKQKYKEELAKQANNKIVDVLHFFQDSDINHIDYIVKQCMNQLHIHLNITIVCQNSFKEKIETRLEKLLIDFIDISYTVVGVDIKIRNAWNLSTGAMFLKVLDKLKGEFFTFIDINTLWNSDHLSRLLWEISCIKQEKLPLCAYSNIFITKENEKEQLLLSNNYPITISDLLRISDNESFISVADHNNLTLFEQNVELKFIKGNQLFHKDILKYLDKDMFDSLALIDGSEHLLLLYLSMINDNLDLILPTYYTSCGLKINSIPEDIKGAGNNIRYSMYPNAPLVKYFYRGSAGVMAGQIYKFLFNNHKFKATYAKYYNNSNNNQLYERISFLEKRTYKNKNKWYKRFLRFIKRRKSY
ncbi:putative glycosyltransferase domain containing protein [Candidatus Hepatincolaceae symbiont of Richtersius coronifer]